MRVMRTTKAHPGQADTLATTMVDDHLAETAEAVGKRLRVQEGFDPSSLLAAAAQQKMKELRAQARNSRATIDAIRAELDQCKRSLETASHNLSLLSEQRARVFGAKPDEVDFLAQQTLVEHLKLEVKRLQDEYLSHGARSTVVSDLLNHNLEPWLKKLASLNIAIPELKSNFELRKGEDVFSALERCRRRLREIEAEMEKVKAAPNPSSVSKLRMRTEIDALAEAGRPSVFHLVESGSPIRWATRDVDINSPDPLFASAAVSDANALMAWLFRDQLKAALDTEIDEFSDDAAALTDVARRERLATFTRDRLVTEREEEFWVEAAISKGSSIIRRPDADPRAVLGLADELPIFDEN